MFNRYIPNNLIISICFVLIPYLSFGAGNTVDTYSLYKQMLLIDVPGVGWTGGSREHDWGEMLGQDKVTIYVRHQGPGKDHWEPPKEKNAFVVQLPSKWDQSLAEKQIQPIVQKAVAEGKDLHVIIDLNITFTRHILPFSKLGENKWAGDVGNFVTSLMPDTTTKWLATHSRGTDTCKYLNMSRFDMAIVSSPRGDAALNWINKSDPSTKVRIIAGLTDAPSWRWNTFSGTGLGHLSRQSNVEIWQYKELGGSATTHSKLQNLSTQGRWAIISDGKTQEVKGTLKDLIMTEKKSGGVSMKMRISRESYKVSENGVIAEIKKESFESRPDENSLFWKENFPEPSGTSRVFVSLRVLAKIVSDCISEGRQLPEECQTLCGIGYLEGYMIQDKDPKDIIIFGLVCKNRPSIRLDDLIVNLRSIANGSNYPYCSLDPKPNDTIALQQLFASIGGMNSTLEMKSFFKKVQETIGPQQVVTGGVPRDSRHAHVMIDADYHMKKVSQGHISIDGVTSYLDLSLNEAAEQIKKGLQVPATGVSMARFWFHIGEESPRFQKGTDIVAIDECSMVILTEKQEATASGELVDVVEDDPHAIAFANEMSEYLSTSGSSTVPIYADLENLFRLRAILLSMEEQKTFESIGWSFSSFIPEFKYQDEKPMDSDKPELANYKEWTHEVSDGTTKYVYSLFPIVCGGVGMDMTVGQANYRDDLTSQLFSFRTAVLLARPSQDSLVWEVPTIP